MRLVATADVGMWRRDYPIACDVTSLHRPPVWQQRPRLPLLTQTPPGYHLDRYRVSQEVNRVRILIADDSVAVVRSGLGCQTIKY